MRQSERRARPQTYAILFGIFASIVLLSHVLWLDLPFFWDECGYYVPAALDLYYDGHWVPRSTAATAHPPGLSAYLTFTWKLAGYSIPASRVAMLLVASATALVAFLLAIRLSRGCRGAPAFTAVALLLVAPVFYTQAMMALADLPAALFTALALLWFLEDRMRLCAAACCALVLTKETGAIVPLVLALVLWRERRIREAGWLAGSLAPLAIWLLVLYRTTGHALGSSYFGDYNLWYPLHPVRLGFALLRRFFFLFVENFHWIGSIALAIAWRRSSLFAGRDWSVAVLLTVVHILGVTLLGGATLERYLLPVLPVLYAAFAVAFTELAPRVRYLAPVALFGGLLLGVFWNPPWWPFPHENNLSMTGLIRLHQAAGEYLEGTRPSAKVVTAWPLSDALRRPEFGYVRRPIMVEGIPDFRRSSVLRLAPGSFDILLLYSRNWEPPLSLLRLAPVERFSARYLDYEPRITATECEKLLSLKREVRWSHGGHWLEIWVPQGGGQLQSTGAGSS